MNPTSHLPKVAFICVHNSCRSQIAEALGRLLAGDVFESYSAGTETRPQINQDAVRLMKQLYGIDMEETQHSKLLADIPPADIVITMGCNVKCPSLPCRQREDWGLDDPTGKPDEAFIEVIRKIEAHIMELKNRIQSGSLQEECLICKAPLEYLHTGTEMECEICHKKEMSKTRCVNGHYVCSSCHTSGVDTILSVCMTSPSKNPVEILNQMMALPFCHMHGPEHHIMVGAALLTAFKNAGGEIDLKNALTEMFSRGKQIPGGACGFWGACGAGVSSGMFVSIITGSTPLAAQPFQLSHKMTARALHAIGDVGGPRCCKRDSYLSIQQAAAFVKEHLGVEMETGEILCRFSAKNNQCIGKKCPFSKNHTA